MALMTCNECKNDVSDKAKACPNCGAPIRARKSYFALLGYLSFGLFVVVGTIFFADVLKVQEDSEAEESEQQRPVALVLPEMIAIPAGSFTMGSYRKTTYLLGSSNDFERPAHSVNVSSFMLSSTEVTFENYDAYAHATGTTLPHDGWRGEEGWGRGNRPVINVSWNDVQRYIEWLNEKTNGRYRLPTEAEWEYAARAGSTTWYSWGDEIGVNNARCGLGLCNSEWDDSEGTAPVGSFKANAFGLYDMHGNVSEWVQDCFEGNYNNALSDGSAVDTVNCNRRVVRGGFWDDEPQSLRSASRSFHTPTTFSDELGFRLAQDL